MWHHRLQPPDQVRLFLALSLSFQGGFLNAGGLLACHRFISHTTGAATQFGAELAAGHWWVAYDILTAPVCFWLGVLLSALLIDKPLVRGQKPHYTLLVGLIALTLLFISASGQSGLFGTFGHFTGPQSEIFLVSLLCLVAGAQNAALTSASETMVRTTHLTGLTTDLGIGLVRLLSRAPGDPDLPFDRSATWLRAGLIFGFISGSTVGALLFLRFHFGGFWFPTLIAVTLWVLKLRKKVSLRVLGQRIRS